VRIGIGGGNSILRGGVSVGKGGARGGLGFGPFHVSGGTRSRSSNGDLEEAIGMIIGPLMVAAIALAIVVGFVFGPLLYVFAFAGMINVIGIEFLLLRLMRRYREIRPTLRLIATNVLLSLLFFGLLLPMRTFVDHQVRTDNPFPYTRRQWVWWAGQYDAVIEIVSKFVIYGVLPSCIVLAVAVAILRSRLPGQIVGPHAEELRRRFGERRIDDRDTLSNAELTRLSGPQLQRVRSLVVNCLAELESFWQGELRLGRNDDFSEIAIGRYSARFEPDIRKLLEIEIRDTSILSALEDKWDSSKISQLSPYWRNRILKKGRPKSPRKKLTSQHQARGSARD